MILMARRRNMATPMLALFLIIAVNVCWCDILFVRQNKAYEMDIEDENIEDNKACQCSHGSCDCCVKLSISKIHVHGTLCAKVAYMPKDLKISLTVTYNGKVVVTTAVSVKNPPPICLAIPGLKKKASACIHFYDLNLKDKELSGCAKLEAKFLKIKIASLEIGCFKIPVANGGSKSLKQRVQDILEMLADISSDLE